MEIAKTDGITAGVLPYIYKGEKYHAVSAIAYFSFTKGERIPERDAMAILTERLPVCIIDEGMPKQRGEFTANFGFTPKDYVSVLSEISVGRLAKKFLGVGNSDRGKPGFYNAGDSVIGGNNSSKSDLVTTFKYIYPSDPRRAEHAGKIPGTQAFELPKDFSFEYFQTAPIDQRLPVGQFWKPGEEFSISAKTSKEGLARLGKLECQFQGKIPDFTMRMFCIVEKDGKPSMLRGTPNLDTLRFVPGGICCAVFHASFSESDGTPIIFGIAEAEKLAVPSFDFGPKLPSDNDLFEWALGIHRQINEKKQRKLAPEVQIKERVKTVRSETKAMRRRRFADIYAEYRDLAIGMRSSIEPHGDRRDYLQLEDEERLSKASEIVEKAGFSTTDSPLGANPFAALLRGELLPDEKNFSQRISSLLKSLSAKDFLEEAERRDPKMFIPARFYKQYFIRFIKSPIECSYEEWGIDKEGTFVIPSGIIVPCIRGMKFISACVFPKGPFNSDGAFVVPGSEPGDYVFWHNGQESDGAPHIVCSDIWDALLLATEMNHLASIECLPAPDADLPDWLKEKAQKTGVIVPCLEKDATQVKKDWSEKSPFAITRVALLGNDGDGHEYQTLRQRLLGELPTFDWIQPFMPIRCVEPEHLPYQIVEAAIDMKLKQNLGVDPFDHDSDLKAIDKAADAEKEKIVSLLSRKQDIEAVETQFEKSKAEAKIIARESPAQIIERQVAGQKAQLEAMRQHMPKDQLGQLDEAAASLDEAKKQFEIDSKACEAVEKSAAAAIAELEASAKAPLEDKIKNSNILLGDLAMLRKLGRMRLEGVTAYDSDWNNADLSGFTFVNASFSRINMDGANLTGAVFEDCSFSECIMENCPMPHASFKNSNFLASAISKCRIEENEWDGCAFRRCKLSELSFAMSHLKATTMSVCGLADCEFVKCRLEETDAEFSEFAGVSFRDSREDKLRLTECKIAGLSLESTGGNLLSASWCTANGFDMTSTSFDSVQMDNCIFEQFAAKKAHWKSAALDNATLKKSCFDSAILEGLYAEKCDFSDASMRLAIAKKSTMKECILQRADLFHANLFCADLSGSSMGDASFAEANLFSVDFSDAKLGNNNFSRALLGCTLIEKLEQRL